MIRMSKGWVKVDGRRGFYSVATLLLINTGMVALLMRAGIAGSPGWPLWRASVAISLVTLWLLWKGEADLAPFVARIMVLLWLLLPVGWLAVAFWNWQWPATDPVWTLLMAEGSTVFAWILTLANRLEEISQAGRHE